MEAHADGCATVAGVPRCTACDPDALFDESNLKLNLPLAKGRLNTNEAKINLGMMNPARRHSAPCRDTRAPDP